MLIKCNGPAWAMTIATAVLLLSGRAEGQSTAGWLTYNGPNFSFNYPPDWKISSPTATKVGLTKGDEEFFVTYTTNFGADINQALTSVEAEVQQAATTNGYTFSNDGFILDPDNGDVSVLMHLTGTGVAPIDVWAEARLSGSAIFLTELIGTPDEVFDDEPSVAWPITRSVHSLAGVSVVGSWSASLPAVRGTPKVEQYQVALVFNSDGTYTYDVHQTVPPAWQLHVSGTYTSVPADENADKDPLMLQLSPQTVTPTGISDLTLLLSSGLPGIDGGADNTFYAGFDPDGSLELVRKTQPPVRFKKAAATITNPDPPVTPPVVQNSPNGPFRFIPVTPCRVADTRSSSSIYGRTLSAAEVRDFSVPLSPCGIPWTAQAYSLNVTAVPTKDLGYISVWPTGQPQPYVSTLNSYDGRFKANAVLVQAGENGGVSVFSTDPTEMVLDINGYFVPASDASGLAFYPLTPCRVSDTRNPSGPLGGPTVQDKESRTIRVTASACGVPENAQAYSLNFTAVPRGVLDYLSVWPTGEAQPYVSTLNAPTGSTTANAAIVPAGTDGSVDVYVSQAADVVVDINGYFAAPAAGALSFYGLAPCRVWDTRNTLTKQPLDGSATVSVANSSCGIPNSAQAVVFNATVVPEDTLGFLALWPDGSNRPLVSTLNSWDASVVSNMAIVPMTNGSVDVFTSDASHTILDASGYFAP